MSKRKQSGLTMITWIVLIAMIGFIGVFAFKLIPIYMDYSTINNALAGVAKAANTGETPVQLKSAIDNAFDINSVNAVKVDDVEIKPDADGKGLVMNLDYDARTNFIANVDLVVHFEKTYQVGH